MQDKYGLLTAPIPQVLRQMTIPMVFGLVSILMFNLVDTFFISLIGTEALASISYTFPVTFALNCITMGIGVGLSTNIAHLLGQGNTVRSTVRRARPLARSHSNYPSIRYRSGNASPSIFTLRCFR